MYYLLVIAICLSFIFFKYDLIYKKFTEERFLKIGTGDKDTPYYNFITLVNSLIGDDLELIIKTKDANSIKNILNVNSGKFDVGICQEEFFRDAYLGGSAFKNSKQENVMFVCGLFYELLTFIMDGDIDFYHLSQLTDGIYYTKKGVDYRRNVIIGTTEYGSGSNANLREVLLYIFPEIQIINIYDKTTDDFLENTVYLLESNTNYIFNLFYKETDNIKLDGIFLTSTPSNIFIKNIVKVKKSVKFLSFYDDFENLSILKNYLYLKELNLSDFYDEINKFDRIRSFASRAIVIANKNASIDDIYLFTKTVFQNNISLYKKLIGNSEDTDTNYVHDFDPVEMSQIDKDLPLHPGAKKYFKEINLITNSKKYEYDLTYYADKVKENYWKYPEFNLA